MSHKWDEIWTACMELIPIPERRFLILGAGVDSKDVLDSLVLDLFFAGVFLTKSRDLESIPTKMNRANYYQGNAWIRNWIGNLSGKDALTSSELQFSFPSSYSLLDLADGCSSVDILWLECNRQYILAWFLRIRSSHSIDFKTLWIDI